MAHTDSARGAGDAPAPDKSFGQATLTGTLRHLWPYIWPGDRVDLKMRVVWSVVLLLVAKLATLSVPFTFKWAIDALTGADTAPVQSSNWTLWLIASPLIMTLSYGGLRVLMAVLTQWRDGIFARVAMHAVRKLAYLTFVHMHELSLRFHLERKTGGLTRVLERGRTGIEVIVRMVILQLVPTIVEVSLLMAVLLWKFDWRYVLATMITVVIYMYYTYIATEWRIEIRRKMNDSDTEANTKAIDSLLNYETVKYFSAEEREARRYDGSMERYEQASVKTYTSLAVLNTGQAIIFTAGLTATMLMCAIGVRSGHNTVGDFVMVNAMMIQLYQPLNFMGMVYREIKQAVIDIEKMFNVLSRNPEIKDIPGAMPLVVTSGNVRFDNVQFAYDPERPILKGLSFEVPAGKTVAIVGPSGAGKSTISRLLFRLYDVSSGRILIDGQDIRNVTQTSLRASIGMVPQDTVLFNDTIRYNIRYGRWDASDAEVEEAAQLAQIDGFIRIVAEGLRNPGWRAGPEIIGRRETARRDRAYRSQGAADPGAGRGDIGARQPHRAGNSGRAGAGVAQPHLARDRAPAVDDRGRRRNHRARSGPHRRARNPRPAFGNRRTLCQYVEPAARGPGGAREAGADRRRERSAESRAAAGRRQAGDAGRGGMT